MENMRRFSSFGARLLRRKRKGPVDPDKVPTVASLLALRQRDPSHLPDAATKGRTPIASLYRMYEYLVLGCLVGIRNEVECFFNQPSWAVVDIPDPQDPDPQRQAILAVLPYYLTVAFNRLIERGLPRGAPAMITPDIEEELRSRPVVLEKEPDWVASIPRLEQALVIPNDLGETPAEEHRSPRLLQMNIISEDPQILFV